MFLFTCRVQKSLYFLFLFFIINSSSSFAQKDESTVESNFHVRSWNFENIGQHWKIGKNHNKYDALNGVDQVRLKKGFDCPLPDNKIILEESENSLTIEWALYNDAKLWLAHMPQEQNYKEYLNWVFSHTKMTSTDSLKHTILIGEKIIEQIPDPNFKASIQKSNEIIRKIINGEIGKLHRLNCIESIPFREYVRMPQRYFFISEFYTLILKRENEIKIISRFLNPKQISTDLGIAPNKALIDELNILLSKNWKISHHLHNHPYFFDNPYGDFGGNLVPSKPDINISVEGNFPIPEFLITNGIDSISLKKEELEKLYYFIK